MNLEVIKTYLLSILVFMSLMLTFALWNYKPNLELLSSEHSLFVNEVDLGGNEEKKRTLIEPRQIAFKNKGQYFSFKSPAESHRLYANMQEWVLKEFKAKAINGRPNNDHQVEVIFPEVLPLEIIKSLFTIEEKESLPNWSFQRMFILFNETTSSLEVVFMSIDGHQQIKFVVNDSRTYAYLWSYIENSDQLNEYIQFGLAEEPIYLPKESLQIKSRSLAVKTINPALLIDNLFENPTLVNATTKETYFTDGQRRMSVLQDARSVEFINPIHSNDRHTDMIALLDLSINDINAHKGWTNDFKLVDIDLRDDLIRYRMFYDGYPVYNSNDLSVIEQQWRNQDLHLYRRPLFIANTLLGGNSVKLPSGEEINNYLINHETYKISEIEDIQAGYKLTYFDGASYDLTLAPTWYMNYNGVWQEIRIDEFMGGGS